MKRLILNLFVGMTILSLLVGCQQVEQPTFACKDIDSPYADLSADFADSSCKYMYPTEFEITYFEDKVWDPSNPLFSEADIVLKFSEVDLDSVYFTSLQISNADPNVAHRWVAHAPFKLQNKTYSWQLFNEANVIIVESDELMTSGLLNPLDFKNDSVIVMQDEAQTTQIKIRYEIR